MVHGGTAFLPNNLPQGRTQVMWPWNKLFFLVCIQHINAQFSSQLRHATTNISNRNIPVTSIFHNLLLDCEVE